MHRRYMMASTLSFGLTACTPARGVFVATDATPALPPERILFATDRALADGLLPTGERSTDLSFGLVDVSIPDTHRAGQIEYPTARGPNTDAFGVEFAARFGGERDLLAAVSQHAPPDEDVLVYVHGYNNTFAEVVYRHAQIARDFAFDGPQISFSWASAGAALGYAYDQSSIAIARDNLENLLVTLATRQRRKIVLLAHSLGSMLVMEALRQMAIGGRADLFDRFEVVALMSPDIDVDVFVSQLRRISPMPEPFVVFVSKADRALRVSAALNRAGERLGSTGDIQRLQALGVDVIDLSDFTDGDASDHTAAFSSPTAISMLRGVQDLGITPDADELERQGLDDIFFEAL